MNARQILSHLAVAALAFALGYAVFSPRAGTRSPIGSAEDPVAAFTDIVHIQDAHARTQAMLDFFAAADPAWAERLREEIDPAASKLVLDEIGETLFASWWARSNPELAFERRLDPAWANRNPWIRETMLAWAATDPSAAAAAANALPPNPDRGIVEATRVLVDHWWDSPTAPDPQPLIELIHKLEVVPRTGAVQRLIELSIDHRGIDATEKFVESLPQQDSMGVSVQNELLARFGQALLERDVARARQWAAKHGEGREGSGVLRHLAYSWGQKNGPEAMQWAMSLPETEHRPGIIYRVWLSFRQTKPEEAAQWLLAQEPSPALMGVYSRYLNGLALEKKTDEALEIAGRTQDPALRDQLRTAVGMGWAQSDPDAALSWLDTVELPAESEARIRQATERRRSNPLVQQPTRG
jgi:hypothetical protein